jgi:hypothetical protein
MRLFAAASVKACQLLAHGQWFSLGTPAYATTKTDPHDIAETLMKMGLSIINKIIQITFLMFLLVLYNYILAHISYALSGTVQLDIDTYF